MECGPDFIELIEYLENVKGFYGELRKEVTYCIYNTYKPLGWKIQYSPVSKMISLWARLPAETTRLPKVILDKYVRNVPTATLELMYFDYKPYIIYTVNFERDKHAFKNFLEDMVYIAEVGKW